MPALVRTNATAKPPVELVTLSLISHTNAGKTSLARTLLRRDVGEVRDAPHVTLFNESHTLIQDGDHVLRLWDTPGFGDSARLLKRLQRERNALLWFLSQTWDRITDKPLWCSQQALKNVRDEADVVLYLVNAGEPPEAAGYLAPEMEVLSWLNKPVLVLLNQTGPVGLPDEEVEVWREHLEAYGPVRAVLTLDAFARCWVQEDFLMGAIAGLLPEAKGKAFTKLQAAWRARNLVVFEDAMRLLADLLASAVLDGVEVRAESLWEKVGIGRSEINSEYAEARLALAGRLAERVERTTNSLILLHGLEGKAGSNAATALQQQFHRPDRVSESIWSVLGSFAGGAMGGLIADLKMGGMTFGGGALVGGLATGLTTYAVIRSYNLVRGGDHRLHWSKDHFREQARLAVLCYLAVAHFGRGRGSWHEGEQPERWKRVVMRVSEQEVEAVDELWKLGVEKQAMPDVVVREAHRLMKRVAQAVLAELYPTPGSAS
jgi:hypothetical protein